MRRNPQKMWEQGVPLREALIRFCGFPNHETDEQAQKDRSAYLLLGRAAEQGEVDTSDREWHRYQPESMEHRRELREKLRKAFCDNLCNQLMVGKLIASGKQIKPIPSTTPEIISPDEIVAEPERQRDEVIMADLLDRGFRSHYPSWDEDVLVGRTAEFEHVRILVDPTDQIGSAQRQPIVDRADRGGRPTERDTILKAFEQCLKKGNIEPKDTQKVAARTVQDYICREMPNYWQGDGSKEPGSGYGVTTITRHIRDRFNLLKNKHS